MLWLVLLLNLLVAGVKLLVGAITGALSVVADGFHSLADASANVIGLVGMSVAARPPDADHPYGHRKYETVAALAVGALLLLASWEILQGLGKRLFIGGRPQVEALHVWLVGLTFPVNLGVVLFESRRARTLRSDLLEADVAHTRTDLVVTASVVASLVAVRWGWPWIDVPVAAAVIVLIVITAAGILRRTAGVLADSAVVPPTSVAELVQAVPGVWHVHRVRSRGRPDSIWIDLHVKVDPAMSTQQSHAIASEVERQLKNRIPGVVDAVVHVEPGLGPSPSEWERLVNRIRAEADGMGVGVHALQIHVEPEGHYSLEMDVETEAGLDLGQAHGLVDRLESQIQEALPAIRAVTTHIEPLRSQIPADPGTPDAADLLRRIEALANEIASPGAAHDLELHRVDGGLTVTMHLTLPARTPLTEAHALAHRVEQRVRAELPVIQRVRMHAEPPS